MTELTAPPTNQEIIRWVKRVNVGILILGALLVAVPTFMSWWVARQLPVVSTVDIGNIQIVGETALCPGQPLVTEYDFHAQGAGVLVRDLTLWNLDPPRTLIYSASRRFILGGAVDQQLRETWHIPASYLDYQTEAVQPIPPGRYRRYMAISSPSRSSVIDIVYVDFEIRDDCP